MTTTLDREDAATLVAGTLLNRASRLARLALRSGARELSRTAVGVLDTLATGPQRVTDLADSEALAQPTVTQLVERLEHSGYVTKGRSPADGRVVLVAITPAGRTQLAQIRSETRARMRQAVLALDDGELRTLVDATEVMQRLIATLQAS
jgi:DNA-binding MarR family transcriptional regulator